jgi:hypothetical protein
MSYHGFGLLALQPSINTSQPAMEFKEIPSTPDLSQFKMTFTQQITPQESSAPIPNRAPPAPDPLPANYSAEAMGCQGKWAVPIKPGNPGYPGFLCLEPLKFDLQYPVFKAFTETTTGSSQPARVDLTTKPTAGGMNIAVDFPGSQPAGSHVTETEQPSGTVTLEALKASCKQYGGAMGPNCCKLPNGINAGIDGGRLVQVLQCDVPKGLGGSLPLIAGAAVVALLLTRGM